MWRKQPEAKPSPAIPPTRESSYPPQGHASQTAHVTPQSAPVAPPQASVAQTQAPAPSPNSALTRGICIKGELTGKTDLLIDGEVQGSIRLGESTVTVGQAGHVRADIEASEIVVRGRVEGDLRGRKRVALGDSCHVNGDLEAPRIAIDDGARFKGRIEMGPAADARERQNKRAPQTSASGQPAAAAESVDITPVGAGTQRNSN